MLTRIALYATLGTLLNALELNISTVGFWLVVGLFWASEHLTRIEVIDSINEEVERLREQRKSKDK